MNIIPHPKKIFITVGELKDIKEVHQRSVTKKQRIVTWTRSAESMSKGDRDESREEEEEDLCEWSTKKVKGGEQRFSGESTVPISYADIGEGSREED